MTTCFAGAPAEWDAIVVGGGPAGSTTARLLAQHGCAVMVLDRIGKHPFCVGETLPPQASQVLRNVGLFEGFEGQQHRPAAGIVSVWGSSKPFAKDFLFSPLGNGWHLDRPRFNTLLKEAARVAGAVVFDDAPIHSYGRHNGRWSVKATEGGLTRRFRTRLLIDAGGRSRSVPGPFPSRRMSDHLIAVAGLSGVPNSGAASQYTFIEAVDEGWFYSALLPSGEYVTAYMTDAGLYAAGRRRSRRYFAEQLAKAPHTRERVGEGPAVLSVFPANSSVRMAAAVPGWMAVGDAARSYDPLSGLGILSAIQMATEAAPAAWQMLGGDFSLAAQYDARNQRAFRQYRQTQQAYYSQEQRWPGSTFWSRRSAVVTTAEPG